jgi:hypothetical protein
MVFIDLKVDFENAMCFDKVQDATVCLKNKRFLLASFSILYDLFSRLMFFLACDKMSQEVFVAIGELILLMPKSSKEGLDSQWEGWHSSKHRKSSGSAVAREQWLKDIASCSARHVRVFR